MAERARSYRVIPETHLDRDVGVFHPDYFQRRRDLELSFGEGLVSAAIACASNDSEVYWGHGKVPRGIIQRVFASKLHAYWSGLPVEQREVGLINFFSGIDGLLRPSSPN